MPKKAYNERLTNRDILALFNSGAYYCDIEQGTVYSGKTKKQLYAFDRDDDGYYFVRLFKQPKHRVIAVSHLIWMFGTKCPIPRGWQIHHHDCNQRNNAFENLIALHRLDHLKYHRLNDNEEPIPF